MQYHGCSQHERVEGNTATYMVHRCVSKTFKGQSGPEYVLVLDVDVNHTDCSPNVSVRGRHRDFTIARRQACTKHVLKPNAAEDIGWNGQ